jgi:uncharacterized membrane protein YqgA involved in biofilm formation
MKELFKKVFSKEIMKPTIMAIISILVLEFIIFPGLTIDNTILNILSGITGVILGIIVLTYVDGKIKDRFEKKEDKLNQESEKTKEDGKIL